MSKIFAEGFVATGREAGDDDETILLAAYMGWKHFGFMSEHDYDSVFEVLETRT